MCNSSSKAVILSIAVIIFGGVIGEATAKRCRRVVGGEYVGPNEFPRYVVRFKMYNKEGTELRCGGTIVSPRHILTAGHCINGRDNVTIYSGSRETDDSIAVVSNVARLIPHPAYHDNGNMSAENDIGIVLLDKDLNLTDGQHTKLELTDQQPPRDGTTVTIFGWGLISDVGFVKPMFLKKANLIMANAQCQFSTPQTFCTNTPDASPCGGDSGSTIVYNNRVIGLHVSDECKGGEVARHTNVHYYREWINSVISQ